MTFLMGSSQYFPKKKVSGKRGIVLRLCESLSPGFGRLRGVSVALSVRPAGFPRARPHPPRSPGTRRYTEGIQSMLDHYHTLTGTLNEAEALLLDEHSQELVRVFRSGHKRLNWNSLGNTSQPSVYRLLPSNCDIRVFVDVG